MQIQIHYHFRQLWAEETAALHEAVRGTLSGEVMFRSSRDFCQQAMVFIQTLYWGPALACRYQSHLSQLCMLSSELWACMASLGLVQGNQAKGSGSFAFMIPALGKMPTNVRQAVFSHCSHSHLTLVSSEVLLHAHTHTLTGHELT